MDRSHTEHDNQPQPPPPGGDIDVDDGSTVQWSPFGPPPARPGSAPAAPGGGQPPPLPPEHATGPAPEAQVYAPPQNTNPYPQPGGYDEPTVPDGSPPAQQYAPAPYETDQSATRQHPVVGQEPNSNAPGTSGHDQQPVPYQHHQNQFGQPYAATAGPPAPAGPPVSAPPDDPAAYNTNYATPGYAQPTPGQALVPYPDTPGSLDRAAVTADDFAQRRAIKPPEPVATMGMRAILRKGTLGAIKLGPGRKEQDVVRATEMVRRNFGGLRQITVINPKGGAGKTVAVLMLAMTFGQRRGGYVLAWDNNETQGTLGMRAQQDFHVRTVRDLLRDIDQFRGPTGRVGDLSQYVRAQGEAMFDVLASDESATAGEMLTAMAFSEIREIVSRFYKLIVVDTGNNVRAHNWQSAMDATDQLVVTMSARNDSAETAARALDHLEQTGRQDLVRRAVTVVSMPAHRKDLDLPAVQRHFAARTRQVLLAPYEKLLDSGEPIRYNLLSQATRDAWLKIAASVSEGL